MKTYYVVTLARYVLVDARDETEARTLGHDALHDLYADLRERFGRDIPIDIQTVRPATDDEIDLWHFQQRMLREYAKPKWKVGDRARLVRMAEDPDPIPVGQRRTVTGIHPQSEWTQRRRTGNNTTSMAYSPVRPHIDKFWQRNKSCSCSVACDGARARHRKGQR